MKFFALGLLLLITFGAAGASVEVAADTPFFAKPDIYSKIVKVSSETAAYPVLADAKMFFSAKHPLARYNQFYKVQLPDGEAYVSNELGAAKVDGAAEPVVYNKVGFHAWRTYLYYFFGIALTAVLYYFVRLRKTNKIAADSALEACFLVAIAVLIREFLLAQVVIGLENAITSMADESGYFPSALGLLNGSLDGKWSMTCGLGIWYMPFIVLLKAKEFYDIAIAFDYFSGFVLGPSLLVLGFLILRKLSLSNRQAFGAILIWAVLPFFYFHIESWELNIFKSFFAAIPDPSDWWRSYSILIHTGFTSMSDVPSCFLIFLTIYLLLIMPAKRRYAVMVGLLFAFACLVRINDIFFAPLFLYLAWLKYQDKLKDWKYAVGLLLLAAGSFLAGFAIQLAINFHQFGNMLTFGYILHYTDWAEGMRPSNGFTWATFCKAVHIKFLSNANHAIWSLGLTGLLLMKNVRNRIIFALWVVPLIWFFLGYSHTFCDARRFIMPTYLPMFAAFCGLELWRDLTKKQCFILLSLIAAALILTAPSSYLIKQMPFDWQATDYAGILWHLNWILPLLLLTAAWRIKVKNAVILAITFIIIFYLANPYTHVLLLLLILLRALWDCFGEIKTVFFKKNP